ncbi:MAG: low-complexity tail membrane protein [Leptolyngbya sp. DLM2.Bin27]|nr:MAG: low-complexity tail membrane protein [Leptolyngbya sp. DLM2.Bin27]
MESTMESWRCDPYLWIHLVGVATVPLWIDLCLLGLAVATPTLPGLELGLIVALGVLPVLVMQLRRPFYIFSLPGLALRPGALKDDQLRLLTQFRRWRVRLGALLVPVPLVWVLVKLYPLAFLAREFSPFGGWGRLGGIAIAVLGFFLANLFLQVPVAVLQVMATPDRRMQTVAPYPADQIAASFTWFGLSVGKILPDLLLVATTRPVVEPLAENLADLDSMVDTSQTLPSLSPLQSMSALPGPPSEAAAVPEKPEETPSEEIAATVSPNAAVRHFDLAEPETVWGQVPLADDSEIHRLDEGRPESLIWSHQSDQIDSSSQHEVSGQDGRTATLPPVPVDI